MPRDRPTNGPVPLGQDPKSRQSSVGLPVSAIFETELAIIPRFNILADFDPNSFVARKCDLDLFPTARNALQLAYRWRRFLRLCRPDHNQLRRHDIANTRATGCCNSPLSELTAKAMGASARQIDEPGFAQLLEIRFGKLD